MYRDQKHLLYHAVNMRISATFSMGLTGFMSQPELVSTSILASIFTHTLTTNNHQPCKSSREKKHLIKQITFD